MLLSALVARAETWIGEKGLPVLEVLARIRKMDLPQDDVTRVQDFVFTNLNDLEARYLKIKAKNIEYCPEWHDGAGGEAWLFVDEIIIE